MKAKVVKMNLKIQKFLAFENWDEIVKSWNAI